MNLVRSRSCRYGQLDVSAATAAMPDSAAMAPRAASNTTSYALPDSHSTASCWVAGMAYPSTPVTASANPDTPAGQ